MVEASVVAHSLGLESTDQALNLVAHYYVVGVMPTEEHCMEQSALGDI